MTLKLRLLCALAALMIAGILSAIPVNAQALFAVVDIEIVLAESDAGIAANRYLSQLTAEKQAQVDVRKAELEALDAEIAAMSPDAPERSAKIAELTWAVEQFEVEVDAINAELDQLVNEITYALIDEIRQVIQIMSEESGYLAVFEAGTVLYARPIVDITWDVIRRYNALRAQALQNQQNQGQSPSAGAPSNP